MADGADDFLPPTQNSIWKVTRQLKKEQSSLYNCVASVLSDAAFVSEVRALYPGLPLLANLRCGLWYTRQADGTCYFKSTDGHNGNWSFSCTRLNWQVCELAAKQGGVIIVDATRKGKRFPDAMTKTIPIWAAVVNRAVARKRAEAAARLAASVDVASAWPQAQTCHVDGTTAVELTDAFCCPAKQQPLVTSPPPYVLQRRDSGGSCSTPSVPLHGPLATWAGAEGENINSCSRVGSLSQWLQSPMVAAVAAKEDDGGDGGALLPPAPSPPLAPCSASHPQSRPLVDAAGRGCGCDVASPEPSADAAAPAGCASSLSCGALCCLELQGEVSFGDLDDSGEASSDARPPLQPLATAAACEEPSEGCGGSGQGASQIPCESGPTQIAAAEAAWLPASQPALSPFAVAASAAAAPPEPVAAEAAPDLGFVAVSPRSPVAAAADSASAAQQFTVEPVEPVDLGAASAAHVSCSPEEGWRRGRLFCGGVVEDCDPDLRLRCSTSSWECPAARAATEDAHSEDCLDREGYRCCGGQELEQLRQLHLREQSPPQLQQQQQQQGARQRRGRQERGGAACCHPASAGQQPESDLDLDGSGGSCSDTCGPTGLGGLTSTRSSSSSSSSLCVSRSSSCSSDQSDAAAAPPAAAPRASGHSGGSGRSCSRACMGDVEAASLRVRPFPRHHTCLVTAPPPWSAGKPRRCGSVPPRPSTMGCGSRLGSGGGSGSSSTGGSGSSSTGGSGSSCNCSGSYASSSRRSSSTGGAPAEAAVRFEAAGERPSSAVDGAGDGGWDVALHLPLWITSNERAQIERRLDGWVDALLRVGADVEGLAKVLRKPLRPLWISQSSTIWVDQVAQPDQLPFTPLYLVSASQPHSYLRQAACCVGSAGGGTGSDADADGDSSDGGPARRQNHKKHRHGQQRNNQQHQQQHAWTYVYVPGAGDDEESWSAGLTPAVFWAHYTELLQAGPTGVYEAVRHVLHREAAALAECGTNSSTLAAIAGSYIARTDQHHLLPAGCRSDGTTGTGGGGAPPAGPGGLFFIGSTGIALGDLSAGTAPGCWENVDAVLSCGTQRHPSMAAEPQWPQGGLRSVGEEGCKAEVGVGVAFTAAEAGQGAAEPSSAGAAKAKGCFAADGFSFRPDAGCGDGSGGGGSCMSSAGQAAAVHHAVHGHTRPHQHHHHHHHHDPNRHHHRHQRLAAPRYLHLPVEHFKHQRTSLMHHLDAALEFLSYHVSRGRKVLIHDTNGLDTCVCVAVALLIACFGPCGGSSSSSGGVGEFSAPSWARSYRTGSGGAKLDPEAVSKDSVRQRLAYVSAFYPPARPTRGMLRQVFNHFVRLRGGGTNADGCEGPAE